MEHYLLSEIRNLEAQLLEGVALDGSLIKVLVKANSRLRNLLKFADSRLKVDC